MPKRRAAGEPALEQWLQTLSPRTSEQYAPILDRLAARYRGSLIRRSAPQLREFIQAIDAPRSKVKAIAAIRRFYGDLSDSGARADNPARTLVADASDEVGPRFIDVLSAVAAGRCDSSVSLSTLRDGLLRARTREQLRVLLRSRLQ